MLRNFGGTGLASQSTGLLGIWKHVPPGHPTFEEAYMHFAGNNASKLVVAVRHPLAWCMSTSRIGHGAVKCDKAGAGCTVKHWTSDGGKRFTYARGPLVQRFPCMGAIWSDFMRGVLNVTEPGRVVVVRYEGFLADPNACVASIARAFDIGMAHTDVALVQKGVRGWLKGEGLAESQNKLRAMNASHAGGRIKRPSCPGAQCADRRVMRALGYKEFDAEHLLALEPAGEAVVC